MLHFVFCYRVSFGSCSCTCSKESYTSPSVFCHQVSFGSCSCSKECYISSSVFCNQVAFGSCSSGKDCYTSPSVFCNRALFGSCSDRNDCYSSSSPFCSSSTDTPWCFIIAFIMISRCVVCCSTDFSFRFKFVTSSFNRSCCFCSFSMGV